MGNWFRFREVDFKSLFLVIFCNQITHKIKSFCHEKVTKTEKIDFTLFSQISFLLRYKVIILADNIIILA